MKILWQNVHYPDITLGGGGARNTRHITESMRILGNNVTLLAQAHDKSKVGEATVYGAKVNYYPRPWLPERLWLIRGIRNCFGYSRSLKFMATGHDAYFCNDPEIVFSLRKLSGGKPVICRVEGTRAGDRASWKTQKGIKRSLKDAVYEFILQYEDDMISRIAWQRCSALIVKSRLIRDELVNWYKIPAEKIAIIPNGVDFQYYASCCSTPEAEATIQGRRINEVLIGFVGRLSEVKNLSFLLEAFSRINSETPIRLIIVGDGDQRSQLELLASTLGISDRVIFTGHKDDVAPYLALFDIFALPSLYETIANCLLEAMSVKLPCVALQPDGKYVRTSSDEVIVDGKTGFLVNGDDPYHFSKALQRLVDEPFLRKSIGSQGHELIKQRFDWIRCAQQYIDLAKNLVCKRSHSTPNAGC